MDVMNSRFKNLGFKSKRKPSSNNVAIQQSLAPPQQPNGIAHTPPLGNNSSTASLPMNQNPNQNQLGRPPSYTYNPHAPRPTSPMPPGASHQQHPHQPPPINTGAYPPAGHPAGHPAMGGAPQPPGYGGVYGAPNGMPGGGGVGGPPGMGMYGNRGSAVEVEGAGRSKAQLIVGIDFVRLYRTDAHQDKCTDSGVIGHHLLGSRIRICDKYRSQRGHYHRMAWCGQSDQAKGTWRSQVLDFWDGSCC